MTPTEPSNEKLVAEMLVTLTQRPHNNNNNNNNNIDNSTSTSTSIIQLTDEPSTVQITASTADRQEILDIFRVTFRSNEILQLSSLAGKSRIRDYGGGVGCDYDDVPVLREDLEAGHRLLADYIPSPASAAHNVSSAPLIIFSGLDLDLALNSSNNNTSNSYQITGHVDWAVVTPGNSPVLLCIKAKEMNTFFSNDTIATTQLITCMAISQHKRYMTEKIYSAVQGLTADGKYYQFYQLDENKVVTKSVIYDARDEESLKIIYRFIVKQLAGSSSSSPLKTTEDLEAPPPQYCSLQTDDNNTEHPPLWKQWIQLFGKLLFMLSILWGFGLCIMLILYFAIFRNLIWG